MISLHSNISIIYLLISLEWAKISQKVEFWGKNIGKGQNEHFFKWNYSSDRTLHRLFIAIFSQFFLAHCCAPETRNFVWKKNLLMYTYTYVMASHY